MKCERCGKPAVYTVIRIHLCESCHTAYLADNVSEQRPPLEVARCYSRTDEGNMDFGKMAKIFENLPCKNIEEDS